MLEVLARVETELPSLLRDDSRWHSIDINYHPPFVERLWCSWNEYRVALHKIHPCGATEALFHPHPWPSAMRIVEGRYEMAVGYGAGITPPPIAARIIGAGDFRYEMTDPDAWHFVRPIDAPATTIMVTGRPWRRAAPRSEVPLPSLDADRRDALIEFFRERYPG
jgi:hypothetical protein